MHGTMSSRRQRSGLSQSSVGSVAFTWSKANFVTCMSQWVDVVIERRKPLRRLVNAMDDLVGSTAGSGDDLVRSLERDIE